MFSEVQPVAATPPTTGLVQSAQRVNDTGWESGLAWRPERCVTHQGFTPCGTLAGEPADSPAGIAYYIPPGFRVRDECSTLDGERDTARIRRQAEAITSFVVARELWNGALSVANPGTVDGTPYVNPYLADGTGTDVTPTASDIPGMLGELEAAAMAASDGMQVFLHVPPALVLPMGNVLRRVGNVLYTPLDNVVVADAGYTGIGAPVPAVPEVQTVTITGGPTGGTFTLTYSGQTTATIAFNAIGSTVQTALNNLSNLDGVTVTGSAGGPYTVTFPVSMGNPAQMTASGAGLTGGTTPGVNVVTATPYVAPTVEAGTWVFATGPVQVRLTPVDVIDDPAETVDRETNRQEIWAERLFAATFDPCVHLAMNVAG
jgi:hypothetical protein